MSALLLVLALAVPQAEPAAPETARTWWEQLPPEQRERMNERWRRYREYGSESQDTLRKRFDAIEQEREMLVRRLSEEERRDFEAMDDAARRRFLDERLRARFRERGEHWRSRAPGLAEGLRDLPPEECAQRLKRFAVEVHAERARRMLDEAVDEGWIGSAAAEWLRQAPADELLSAVGQVQRWRFLERAGREGLWEKFGIGPEERLRMLELPIPHFFEEVRRLESGEPLLGPPCDWRREGPWRGFGRGGGPPPPGAEGGAERPPRERRGEGRDGPPPPPGR